MLILLILLGITAIIALVSMTNGIDLDDGESSLQNFY